MVKDAVDNIKVPPDKVYYKTTTMCPKCRKLVPGEVVSLGGGVFITRECREHGYFRGLICSDMEWYERLPEFDVEPIAPGKRKMATVRGCPMDCGLCPSHRQKAGTAAIEISNKCNLSCPTCLANNTGTFELTVDEFREAIEGLQSAQGHIDVLIFSGGEPTIHPKLFEMLDIAEAMDIGRIVVNTNGKRIAEDDVFLGKLAARERVYMCLHYDGSRSKDIRGVESALQETALRRLSERNINAIPLILATGGVNDGELGSIVERLLKYSNSVKTVMLSMMTYAGSGGEAFFVDQNKRMTIAGALDCIEKGSGRVIAKKDFMPLPMPNPLCAAIGYFLVDGEKIMPLLGLLGRDKLIEFLGNSHFVDADERFEEIFREMVAGAYADTGACGASLETLNGLKRLFDRLFPKRGTIPTQKERRRLVEESIKSVYLMQFMDCWTFDSVRLSKCSCQHLLPDGVIMPSCGYYALHRGFDARYKTAE